MEVLGENIRDNGKESQPWVKTCFRHHGNDKDIPTRRNSQAILHVSRVQEF